ncbi:MAG: PEP/pyruvate-binding domain-containing protein [Pseudomonadota bacterium]
MPPDSPPQTTGLLQSLQERAKELACLYRVEEILRDVGRPIEDVFQDLVVAIPSGWQHPEHCQVRITWGAKTFCSPAFVECGVGQCAPIRVRGERAGLICVQYSEGAPVGPSAPFLPEEAKLVETIAERVGAFALHQRLSRNVEDMQRGGNGRREWQVALDLLKASDRRLYDRIARRMVNQLCWHGLPEARALLQRYGSDARSDGLVGEVNRPRRKASQETLQCLRDDVFALAAEHLDSREIEARIRRWVAEERSAHLVQPLLDVGASLAEVGEAVRRIQMERPPDFELSQALNNSLRAALIRRFVTDRLENIRVAKRHLEVEDFLALAERVIGPAGGTGKLGGKGAGLFLAYRVLQRAAAEHPELGAIRTPSTWYLASDGLQAFVHYNGIEEVFEQKYKAIDEVRQDYPHIVQLFKGCPFPRELVRGLEQVLDDLGEVPLVVRSSSLLEDQLGAAFSGKYKSLFLANQGPRGQRLEALQDAIAEIYASVFGPDPIGYRAERGLLDFNEEMGVLIQAVVGNRVGRYYLPTLAGVAFSRNEFRWSPRIRREDGLIRLVPGLGTRAVDRLTDDHPVLLAPGRPDLRVNATLDEVLRYAPRKMDVIDLERDAFRTVYVHEFLAECAQDLPGVERVVSILRDHFLVRPTPLATDYTREDLVVTFEGLLSSTPFVKQLATIMAVLEEALGTPVDIEFAHDGRDLYLLQCRPQSSTGQDAPAQIPRNLPAGDVIFTAHRHVSNGRVPDLRYLVYVDPAAYAALPDEASMAAVGRAVGRLNDALPRRRFALLGPGRWGSRGDIQLGVRVTYSDISNTALLVEIARRKGAYVPDLSFGTHFFQDLVEASIRYLPLYPDEHGVRFDERFFLEAPNLLASILPEDAHLAPVLKVIDVTAVTGGRVLRVLMNADEDTAIGLLAEESGQWEGSVGELRPAVAERPAGPPQEECWRWRQHMAVQLARNLDPVRFGVVALYLIGSVKNATAGPASDIDLLVHHGGDPERRAALERWLEGWSRCLAEMCYLRTGHRCDGLLDVHFITDEDIAARTSFAVKIGAPTDPARRLELGARPQG